VTDRRITVALAGNPNSGKTTIFNKITGAQQHVGNYPGVTVEKKEGFCRHNGVDMLVVDLPGTYSLTAYSVEEIVARNFVVDEKPDVVIDIIDSSNLERNLYLATQFIELGVPLVLAFNMSDVAKSRGYVIDIDKLSDLLDVRIVSTIGHKGKGVKELLDAALEVAGSHHAAPPSEVKYGREIEEEIGKIAALIKHDDKLTDRQRPRWLALKLLENDSQVREKVLQNADNHEELITQVESSTKHIEKVCGDHPEILIADRRYGFISGACQETLVNTVEARHTKSDKIDAVILNRFFGLPIFAALMFLVFKLVFTLGEPAVTLMEGFFAWVSALAAGALPEGMLRSLVIDGVIGGVGGVLTFVPTIALLYFAIALLEDSGYVARAAFTMDTLMHRIGLHGRSFIPMLIGFGCNVPAILATRTLESRRDRLTTMMIVPLMSCSARLPIYLLMVGAFFPESMTATMLFIMYVIGVVVAIAAARILRSTVLKGPTTPFVMELPPYRMPTIRGLVRHTWERTWMFVRKAGTIILVVSVVLWFATSFPKKTDFDRDYQSLAEESKAQGDTGELSRLRNEKRAEELSCSLAGRAGRLMEPAIRLMGFDWQIGTGLIGAFAAKEVFVAQMGIVFSLGETDEGSDGLRGQLRARYTPLVGFCVMLFCLLGMPCLATVAITWRESGSWRWALFQVLGLTALAYVITVAVYQVGHLLTKL